MILLTALEEVTEVRMLVKRSVVATRGRRRVEGMAHMSWRSPGQSAP